MPKKKNNGSTPQAGGSSEQRRALTERIMRYTNLCTMSSCAIPGASGRVAAERQSIQTALDAGVAPAVSDSPVEAAIIAAALQGVDGSWSAQQVFEAVRAVQCSVRDSVQEGDAQPLASAEDTAAEKVEECATPPEEKPQPQKAAETPASPKKDVLASTTEDAHDSAVTAAEPVQRDVPPATAHGAATGLPASGGRAEERKQLRRSMFEFVNLCSMASCFTSPGIQARLKKARETVRSGLEKKITPLDPDTNPGDRRVLEIARQGAAGEKSDKEIQEALLEEKNADTQRIDPARRDETPQPDSASTKAATPQEQAPPPPPNEKAQGSETSAPAAAPQAPCVPEPATTTPTTAASDPAPTCVTPATSAAKADQEALRAKLLRFANMCTLATKMPSAAIDAHIAATRVAIRGDLDNGVALSPSGDHAERECLDVALRAIRGEMSPAEVHRAVIGVTPTGVATTSASPAPEPTQTTASKQAAPPRAKVKKPPTVETKVTALRQARARCDQRFDRRNVQRVCDALSAITAGDVQSMSEGDAKRALEGIVDANGYTNEKFEKESELMGRVPMAVRLLFEKTGVRVPRPDIDGMFSEYVVEYLKSCSTSVFLNRDETPIDELLDNFRRWWHDTKVHHPVLTPAELKQAGKTLAANAPTGLTVVNIKGELRVRKAAQVAILSPDPETLKDTAAPQPDVKALRALAVKAVRASPPYALSKAALLESFGKAQKSTVTETAKKRAWKDIVSSPPDGFEVIKEDGELKLRWTEAPATPQSTAKTANNGTTSAKKTPAANKTAPTPVDRAAKQKASAAKEVAKATPTATSPVSESPPVSAFETDAAESSGGDEDYDETAPPEQFLLRAVMTMCGGVGNVIGKKSDAIKRAQRRFPFLTETALKKAWKVLVDDGCVKVTDGTAALHRAELLEPPVPLAAAAAHWILTKEEEARKALLEAEADSREGIECYRTYKLLGSGLSTAPYADVKHLVQRIAAVRHVFAQLSFPGEAYVSTMVLTLEARLKTVPSQAHVNSLFSEFVRDVNAPSSLRSKSEDTRKQWYFEAFTQRRWVLLHPLHRLEQIRLDAAWQHVTAQTKSPEPAVAPVTPKPKQAEPTDAIAAAIQDLSYHSLREMYLEEEDVINIVLVVVGCWSELVTASQPCTKGHAISRITTQGPVHPLMKKQPQRCRDALERCFGMNLCYDKPNAGTTLLRLTAAGAARLYRVKAAWVAKTEPTPSPPPPAPTSARLSPMPVSPAPASPLVPPTPVPVQVPVRVAPTPSVLPQAPAVVVPQPTVEMSYHSLREMYLEEQDVVIVALIVVGCWSELVTASQPCTKGNAISRATMQGPVHPLLKKDSQRCRDALERCVALKYCDETKNADGHSVLSLSGTGVSRLAAVKTKWVGKMAPSPSPPPVSTAPPQAPVTPVPAQTPSPPVAVARVAPLPQVSVRVGTDSAPANLSHAALANMYMEEGDEVIIALIVVGCWSELVTASQPCTKGNAISRATMQGPVHPLLMKDSQRCRGALERCVALKYCVEQKNADGHGVLSLSPAGASRLSAVKAKWAAKIKETWPGSSSPGPPALTPSPAPVAAVASAPPAATPQGSATKPAAPPPKRVLKKTPVGQLPTSPCPGAMLTPPPAAPAAVVPPQRTVPGRSVLHPGAPQALDNTLLSAFMGPSTVAPQPRDNPPSMTMQSARAAPEHSFDPFDLYSTPSPSSAAHTAAAPALAKKKQQAPPTPPLAQAPYEQTTPAPAIASTAADAFFEQPAASAPRRTIAQDKVEAAMNAFFQ